MRFDGKITKEVASTALDLLEVDAMGLDINDRTMLLTIIEKFAGGPVGLDTLAAAIGEDSGTIEEVYEPLSGQERSDPADPRKDGWRRSWPTGILAFKHCQFSQIPL